jgi:hypothetical protein
MSKKTEKPEETTAATDETVATKADEATEAEKEAEAKAVAESEAKPAKAESKTIEAWQLEFRLAVWEFAALVQLKRWKSGKSVTKAEFEAALKELKRAILGG